MTRPHAQTSSLRYWGELCPALLSFLLEQPLHAATTQEVYRTLRCRYDFPPEWMLPVESSGGEPYFENRIRAAREYLCQHGLIHRSWARGIWKLTPRGVETPPTECPAPAESFRSKTGHTVDAVATALQRFHEQDPVAYQKLLERCGIM